MIKIVFSNVFLQLNMLYLKIITEMSIIITNTIVDVNIDVYDILFHYNIALPMSGRLINLIT